jgi:hypothetical protein
MADLIVKGESQCNANSTSKSTMNLEKCLFPIGFETDADSDWIRRNEEK